MNPQYDNILGAFVAFGLASAIGLGALLVRMWSEQRQHASDIQDLKDSEPKTTALLMDIRDRIIRLETKQDRNDREARQRSNP